MMARSLGWIFLLGPVAALAWFLVREPRSGLGTVGMLGMTLATAVMGVVLVTGRLNGAPRGMFFGLVAAAGLTVSLAVFLVGSSDPAIGFYYLWATPYSFMFFSVRQAAAQVALMAGGLAAALRLHDGSPAALDPNGLDVTYWVLAILTVLVVGVLIRRLAQAAQTSDLRFRRGFEQTSIAIALVDGQGLIADANPALCLMLMTDQAGVLGRPLTELVHRDDRHLTAEALVAAAAGQEVVPYETRYLRPDGALAWARVSLTLVGNGDAYFYTQVEDVTASTRAQQERAALARDLELILRSAGDGIFRVDISGRIVYVNPAACQILGWDEADLLGAYAHRMLQHSHADGTTYPSAGSPLQEAISLGGVRRVSDEVMWRKDGTWIAIDATCAPVREDDRVIGAVCVFADITDRIAVEAEVKERLEWRERIKHAIEDERFVVYAQPIIDLGTGLVCHEELLIRMLGEHPGDVITPCEFLPQAEKYGLVVTIDRWMIGQALEFAASGRSVAANISAQSLVSAGLLDDIASRLRQGDIDPQNLIFEITETAAVDRMRDAKEFARSLTHLGCKVALDDFGTGYGSFSYLKSLPADFLKIDIEFVRDLADSGFNQRIVETIVGMARDFGQMTIAEGVEDQPTLDLLREYGVDFAQGYFIGGPSPIETVS